MAWEFDDITNLDEAWLEKRHAEIDAYRRISPPGEDATEAERAAYIQVIASLAEATEALKHIEETFRQRQIEASKARQQAVQWEVVRLRLRKTMGNQSDSRRKTSTALVSRMLPSDRGLTSRLGDADFSEQRRYLGTAIENFQKATPRLPPEEALAESRVLLEYFSLLQQPRSQDAAAEHRSHSQISDQIRELRGMANNFERQLAMQTMASRAMNLSLPADADEN